MEIVLNPQADIVTTLIESSSVSLYFEFFGEYYVHFNLTCLQFSYQKIFVSSESELTYNDLKG